MNKNSVQLKQKIKEINKLLVKYYGIPDRPKKLPNPVNTLIATILSQNTNDRNSYQAYQNLWRKYKSLDDLAMASRSEIEKVIRIAGLGRQKSAAIKTFLSVIKQNSGKINLHSIEKLSDEEIISELTSIKGIGIKTASCVLLFSLDRNVCPVDTHVHRTLNRIGIVRTKTPDKTFNQLKKLLPDGIAHPFHTNLIKLGREICKPANPICSFCPIEELCTFRFKNFDKKGNLKENTFMLLDEIR